MIPVFWKELSDHFGRRRFVILLGLILFASTWAGFVAVRSAGSCRTGVLPPHYAAIGAGARPLQMPPGAPLATV